MPGRSLAGQLGVVRGCFQESFGEVLCQCENGYFGEKRLSRVVSFGNELSIYRKNEASAQERQIWHS